MLSMLTFSLFVACQSEIDTKQAADVKDVPAANTEKAKKPSPLANKKLVKKPAPGAKVAPAVTNGLPLADGSKVEFIGAKVTGDHKGGFEKVKGSLSLGESGSVEGVNLEIDMTSVYADPFPYAEKFVSHLKDEDFFHIEKYPTATFKSTSIEGTKVTGIFDMRGVQKEVSFDAQISDKAPYTLKAEFKINRKLWGIEYAGKADDLIKDDVAILANLQFGK